MRVIPAIVLVSVLMPFGYNQSALATPPVSHDISTCADLQTLGADPSAAGDTINLTADLDCTGLGFTSMFGGGFTGIFDGHGHSISNLTINQPGNYDVGLFSNAAGATIQNLTLASGSVTGSNAAGALIGQVSSVTITNVTSHIDISSAGSQVGGLIGMVQGPGTTLLQDVIVTGDVTDSGGFMAGSYVAGIVGYLSAADGDSVTLERVAYTGTVSADGGSRTGGLLGVAFVNGNSAAATVTIEDSYNAGTVDTTENEVGGIIGSAIAIGNGVTSTISLNRVYNSGAVTGTDGVGGLFGIGNSTHTGDALTITDSFSAGLVTATVANGGALVGANSADPPTVITTTNSYYDGPGTGQTVCASLITPTGTCTSIDTGARPDYFKGNHTSAPLDNWDFAAIWTTNPGAYPTLIPRDDGDGIDLADEAAAPNSGDANGDGIADAAEPGVASFPDPVSGHYAVLQASCGALFNVQIGAEAAAPTNDVAYNYPVGLIGFVVTGCTPGATATITQYFYGNYNPSTFVMRAWNSNLGTYTTVPGTVFTAVTIGGQTALKAVYQITDGSSLDRDGHADGNIVDPVGPAVNVVGVPDTGLGFSSRR